MINVESSATLTEAEAKQALINYLQDHKGVTFNPDDDGINVKLELINGTAIERPLLTDVKVSWQFKPKRK